MLIFSLSTSPLFIRSFVPPFRAMKHYHYFLCTSNYCFGALEWKSEERKYDDTSKSRITKYAARHTNTAATRLQKYTCTFNGKDHKVDYSVLVFDIFCWSFSAFMLFIMCDEIIFESIYTENIFSNDSLPTLEVLESLMQAYLRD